MPLKPPRSVKTIEAGKALFAIALFCVVTAPLIQTAQAASLEELRAQKIEAENRAAELEKEADSKKGKVDELTALVSSLNKQIANYQALIAKTQYNIASTEKSIQETEAQIKEKEALLADNQAKQAEALQTMYVMGRKSTLESLITSQSLSEVVARDQYLSALEEKIENMMREIKQLKKDLETKRQNLSQKRQELLIQQEQQKAYKATIESQRNQQKVLLNGALAEKNKILADIKEAKREVDRLSQAELAERRRLASKFKGTTIIGGSSYESDPDVRAGSDQYGPYDVWGYYTHQCVSYAAWYLNNVEGRRWVRVSGYGHAKYWKYTVGPGSANSSFAIHNTPAAGAVISWTSGTYGHVAIVNKVYSDGTMDISDYNRLGDEIYRYTEKATPEDIVSGPYVYLY